MNKRGDFPSKVFKSLEAALSDGISGTPNVNQDSTHEYVGYLQLNDQRVIVRMPKDVALLTIKYHGRDSNRVLMLSYHDLLRYSHLGLPCSAGNALCIPSSYGGHDLSGVLLLVGFFMCPIEVLKDGAWVCLEKAVDLPFIRKLMKGLLQFYALGNSMAILLMKFIVLSCVLWLWRHGLQHGVPLHVHQYAPRVRGEARAPNIISLSLFSWPNAPIPLGFSLLQGIRGLHADFGCPNKVCGLLQGLG